MRHAGVRGETPDRAWEQAETSQVRRFLATLKQSLQAQANAEERNSVANAIEQRLAHLHLVESAHHLAVVSDTGEDNFGRAADASGVVEQLEVCSDLLEGVLD
jgi:hypothetical protein